MEIQWKTLLIQNGKAVRVAGKLELRLVVPTSVQIVKWELWFQVRVSTLSANKKRSNVSRKFRISVVSKCKQTTALYI